MRLLMVEAAKRAAKQSGDAAEDFVNDLTRRIQRNPLLTVAVTFVTGLAVGTLAGSVDAAKVTTHSCACGHRFWDAAFA